MKQLDKSKWEDGPWKSEPDQVNFKTEEGLDAAIVRSSHSGSLCGYVGIPKSHPWHGKGYSDLVQPTAAQNDRPVDLTKISPIELLCAAITDKEEDAGERIGLLVDVHGGLTYAGAGIAEFNEDPDLWYFGFDCAHSGDRMPAYEYSGSYRDIPYVKKEIAALSKQLFEVK